MKTPIIDINPFPEYWNMWRPYSANRFDPWMVKHVSNHPDKDVGAKYNSVEKIVASIELLMKL
jgi:hypothetical protein